MSKNISLNVLNTHTPVFTHIHIFKYIYKTFDVQTGCGVGEGLLEGWGSL